MKSSAARPADESKKFDTLTREMINPESNNLNEWQTQLASKNEAILKSIEELIDQSLQNNPDKA